MTFFPRQRQTCKIVENPSKYKGFRIVTLFGMKAIRGSCSSAFRLKQTPVFFDFRFQKRFTSRSKNSLAFLYAGSWIHLDTGSWLQEPW